MDSATCDEDGRWELRLEGQNWGDFGTLEDQRLLWTVEPCYFYIGGCHHMSNSLDSPQTSTGETKQHNEQGKAGVLLIFGRKFFTVITHRGWAACDCTNLFSLLAATLASHFQQLRNFWMLSTPSAGHSTLLMWLSSYFSSSRLIVL